MLRFAGVDDLPMILKWRNHGDVRAVSGTTHVIKRAEHLTWWRAFARDPNRGLFVFTHEGEDCGVVTFDRRLEEQRGIEWGFYLDIDGLMARGTLLAAWIALELAAVRHAFDVLGAASLCGMTRADNEAVLLLHKRFGFTVSPDFDRLVDGEWVKWVWTSLTADAWAARRVRLEGAA